MRESLAQPASALAPGGQLVDTMVRALEYEANAKAPNTRRAYSADWADFASYCALNSFESLPARDRVVQLYIAWCADAREPRLKLSSISRRLAAISTIHKANGFQSPTQSQVVQDTWDGIRRAHQRTRGAVPKRSITEAQVRDVVALLRNDVLADIRDRAMLLFLFLGGFRRSELAGIETGLIAEDAHGVIISLRESKTNQLGAEPERVALARDPDPAIDPVRAYALWRQSANIDDGYLFRSLVHGSVGESLSDRAVHAVVRSRIVDALCAWLERNIPGDDPVLQPLRSKGGRWIKTRFASSATIDTLVQRFALPPSLDPRTLGAHSFRSGLVTTARAKGKPDYAIKRQTRHKHSAMLDRYTHPQDIWRDNVSRGLL